MKIAIVHQPIVTTYLNDLRDSIGIWSYEVARRLARSCDVIVYAKRGLYHKKDENDQGVHYRRISTIADRFFTFISTVINRLFPKLFPRTKHPLFASSLYYLTYVLQVAKDLRAKKCDIVHIHNFSQFVPIIRAFNPKIKIVLHVNCEWLTQLDRAMIERRLREVDLVIGCSEYITDKIRRGFPQFAERCQTIFNGVDVNHFVSENNHSETKKNSVKRLLFIGRVSPEKGLHILLDAFKRVVERYPQAQLKVVGPIGSAPIEFIVALSDDPKVSDLLSFYNDSYFSHLRDKLSSGMANRVSFAGSFPQRQLINHYRDADVFIFPSVWDEPFGMPLVEAMAAEVPVVATRVGGIPEIVEDGKTGLLVKPNDFSALAEGILHLLSDEDLRKSMGKAARKRAVELFSWDQVVENLLYQYKNMCEGDKKNILRSSVTRAMYLSIKKS